jgi:hypothetical protein
MGGDNWIRERVQRPTPAYPTHTSPSAARTCAPDAPYEANPPPSPPPPPAPAPAPPPTAPFSPTRMLWSHRCSTRSAERSSRRRSAGVCSCCSRTSRRSWCARCTGVANSRSYAACTASGESLDVAVQVGFEAQSLETRISHFKAQGLRPGTFPQARWVNWIQLVQPPPRRRQQRVRHRVVALQVAFERQTLKPVFQLIDVRLWV